MLRMPTPLSTHARWCDIEGSHIALFCWVDASLQGPDARDVARSAAGTSAAKSSAGPSIPSPSLLTMCCSACHPTRCACSPTHPATVGERSGGRDADANPMLRTFGFPSSSADRPGGNHRRAHPRRAPGDRRVRDGAPAFRSLPGAMRGAGAGRELETAAPRRDQCQHCQRALS